MTAVIANDQASAVPMAFALPPALEAHEPPEARGLARDDVRLMVSFAADEPVLHAHFRDLPSMLVRGDVLVVNTSATINAALMARRSNGEIVELHRSQTVGAGLWVVELRRPTTKASLPLLSASAGEVLAIPMGGTATLIAPYHGDIFTATPWAPRAGEGVRLWLASVELPETESTYLARHGFPIRYSYVSRQWPLSYYQTIFAREPGSAEMPSAGRAFTRDVARALDQKGVQIAPVLLHTGVSSLEGHEPPYAERYRVEAAAARLVNECRREGGRVIAVGTTVVRALETVAARDGTVAAGEGWTDLVISPTRALDAVDALLTGFHEPRASHLAMLEALAGRAHVEAAYAAALEKGYLWHEFGDLHLIVPRR